MSTPDDSTFLNTSLDQADIYQKDRLASGMFGRTSGGEGKKKAR
ncbi:hypothetical protein LptCag_0965 [Leptospirillum ferriphilum]|uniref:Uncharacterized protein n=1 Tax=Leptospirillum ferriphilum TaxID=178606 RepID=A0A094WEY2_9BACT|nr:hypothetical protein LptCag_0965 [Leptospirillum ferriphilum]